MTAIDPVTTAAEGTTYTLRGDTYTVGPKCESQLPGAWVCVTHAEVFRNQLAKDGHIDAGEHVLAWVCGEHGPEVP
jgi:hypothetical protein